MRPGVAAMLVAVLVAILAGTWLVRPAGSGTAKCKPGVRTVNGLRVRAFCGPATSTVQLRVGSSPAKTYVFKNGRCDRHPKYFDINIGKVVLGVGAPKKKRPRYFGLLMGRSPAATSEDPIVSTDGTYAGGLIAIETGTGASYELHGGEQLKITLKQNRHAGSFVGEKPGSSLSGEPSLDVTGTFTCSR